MEQHDIILTEEDANLLNQHLIRFTEDTGVRIVLLISREGHLMARQGDAKGANIESLCALSVGAFASSEALARLAGEEAFSSIYHQGIRCNVYISLVSESHLMLALFDYHASAPLVRLQAKVTAEAIVNVLGRAYVRQRAAKSASEA